MNKVWAVTAAVITLAAGGLVSAGTASATTPSTTPVVVNFTHDTAGAKANGFQSSGFPQVYFDDTLGSDLYLADFGDQSHGNGLAVHDDDASALQIRLSAPTSVLSLAFGNDDSSVADTSDQAELELYRGALLVGRVDVNVNANDKMDQTIGISGQALFNRATFQYVNAAGSPLNLIEIVDDVTVGPLCTIAGTPGNDHLVGTSGNDIICGDDGDDTISGGGGDDLIYGGRGADHLSGAKGKDALYGGSGKDELLGGKGKDSLNGGKGKDNLVGGTGKDALAGGTGSDHCDGGPGTDTRTSCEVHVNIP